MSVTTVKDKIADIMRKEGFDFMTAYEEAQKAIERFNASGKSEETLRVGKTSFVLKRNTKKGSK
jgi:hypothetical protein